MLDPSSRCICMYWWPLALQSPTHERRTSGRWPSSKCSCPSSSQQRGGAAACPFQFHAIKSSGPSNSRHTIYPNTNTPSIDRPTPHREERPHDAVAEHCGGARRGGRGDRRPAAHLEQPGKYVYASNNNPICALWAAGGRMSCVHGGRPIWDGPQLTPCPSLDTHPLAGRAAGPHPVERCDGQGVRGAVHAAGSRRGLQAGAQQGGAQEDHPRVRRCVRVCVAGG